MFASMLGVLLSLFVAFVLFFFVIGGIVSASSTKTAPIIKENSVLHIQLNREIQDLPSNNPFENIDFNTFEDKTPLSLSKIIENIEKAKYDDNIKGIYLDVDYLMANLASTEELRNALIDFKTSNKFIISYAENFEQNKYYLSSAADHIYLNPAGNMTFKGLATQLMFFKDALSRLDIDMQVIRHGKFKSAIEPFTREDMSEANEEQMETLLNSIWMNMATNISESRNIEVEALNEYANTLAVRSPEDAVELGFIDDLYYEDEVKGKINELLEADKDSKINFVNLNKYKRVKSKKPNEDGRAEYKLNSKNKIAVIFAEGEIVSGESRDNQMGSETIAEAIKKAREDDRVKAVVLRVNSPGGSALASDVMWRETQLLKESKPLIVSMGDLAASGGYYISCGADKIFAESSTITGSIGVFGLIPNVEGMLKSKLGIDIDGVNSHDYADGLTLLRPMKPTEREAIQESVERVYDDFTSKVAEGRKMTQAEVDSIGQGRVWSGETAKSIGLVDEIGGLNAAIEEAISIAELEDYKIKKYPEAEDPIEKMIKDLSNNVKINLFSTEIGKVERYYNNFKQVMDANGIYTRLPIDIIIE